MTWYWPFDFVMRPVFTRVSNVPAIVEFGSERCSRASRVALICAQLAMLTLARKLRMLRLSQVV